MAMGASSAPRPDPSVEIETCTVFPACWTSVTTFIACETQWRVAAHLAGIIWLGLDYSAVDVVMRRLSITDARVFADLQVMEAEALAVFAKEGRS